LPIKENKNKEEKKETKKEKVSETAFFRQLPKTIILV